MVSSLAVAPKELLHYVRRKTLWRDGAGMYGKRHVGNVRSSLLKISTRRLLNATSLDLHLCFFKKAT